MAEERAAKRERSDARRQRRPFETVRALALAVLLALGIRSFLVEPFKIPSGSMIPTLLVGDYIIVNKFAYGVREPFSGRQLFPVGKPERGHVVVFRYPDNPSIDYIKRIVGMPGDSVEMREGRLWVNGQPIDRIAEGEYRYHDYAQSSEVVKRRYRELALGGVEYTVIRNLRPIALGPSRQWTVPAERYFMMGDNRDNSRDSRLWDNPFVRPDQIKGRAIRVHWSWVVGPVGGAERGFFADLVNTLWRVITLQVKEIRWNRVGRSVDGLAD
jgi:signal peptidase I